MTTIKKIALAILFVTGSIGNLSITATAQTQVATTATESSKFNLKNALHDLVLDCEQLEIADPSRMEEWESYKKEIFREYDKIARDYNYALSGISKKIIKKHGVTKIERLIKNDNDFQAQMHRVETDGWELYTNIEKIYYDFSDRPNIMANGAKKWKEILLMLTGIGIWVEKELYKFGSLKAYRFFMDARMQTSSEFIGENPKLATEVVNLEVTFGERAAEIIQEHLAKKATTQSR